MTDNVTEILMPMRDLIDAHGSLQVFDAAWLMSKSEDEDAILTRMKEILLKEIPICDLVKEIGSREGVSIVENSDPRNIHLVRVWTPGGSEPIASSGGSGPAKILVVVD